MIIETMFNVGDQVMFMYADKIATGSVSAFYFNSGGMDDDDLRAIQVRDCITISRNVGITYKIQVADREIYFPEHKLFKTKEELIQSL